MATPLKGGPFPPNPEPPSEYKRIEAESPERKAAAIWLRENFPEVAGFVDQFADAFGRSNFAVTFAGENGHVIGTKCERGAGPRHTASVNPCAWRKPAR